MKYRKLRIAWSVAWGILCLILILAWLRNFWSADAAWMPLPGNGQLTVVSTDGQFVTSITNYGSRHYGRAIPNTPAVWGWQSFEPSKHSTMTVLVPWKKVVRYRIIANGDVEVSLPHWLLVIVSILIATSVWIRWSWRYSIRTMLVITTLAAVVVALATSAGHGAPN